jgi:hypothetical protein
MARMPTDLAARFLARAGRLCHEQATDLYALMDTVLAGLVLPSSPSKYNAATSSWLAACATASRPPVPAGR